MLPRAHLDVDSAACLRLVGPVRLRSDDLDVSDTTVFGLVDVLERSVVRVYTSSTFRGNFAKVTERELRSVL